MILNEMQVCTSRQSHSPASHFSPVVTREHSRYSGAVKGVPGTLQEGGAPFESTHWSVVLLAAQSQPPVAAQAALTNFCQAYWPPLYTFLRRRGHSPGDAQDLTQAFFAHLLEQKTLARASHEKGRLRTFLLGSLQHFLANAYDHAQAYKRGGGKQIVSMDDQLVEAEAATLAAVRGDETSGYDHQWAANLVRRAWTHLSSAMVSEGKRDLLETLEPFVVGGQASPPSQDEAAARLQMPISTFRNALRRLRQRYRECIRSEVVSTVSDASEVEEEMHHLLRVLLS